MDKEKDHNDPHRLPSYHNRSASASAIVQRRLSVYGIPLLDVMDETVGTLGLHIAAILLAVAFTWFLSPDIFWSRAGYSNAPERIIFFLCKYVIPASLLLTIGVQLVTGIGIPGISGISGSPCIDSLLRVEGIALIAVLILVVVFITRRLRKA